MPKSEPRSQIHIKLNGSFKDSDETKLPTLIQSFMAALGSSGMEADVIAVETGCVLIKLDIPREATLQLEECIRLGKLHGLGITDITCFDILPDGTVNDESTITYRVFDSQTIPFKPLPDTSRDFGVPEKRRDDAAYSGPSDDNE